MRTLLKHLWVWIYRRFKMSGSFMTGFVKGVADEERKKLEALKAVNTAQGGLMSAISNELNRKDRSEQNEIANTYKEKVYKQKLASINKKENDKIAELASFTKLTEAYTVPVVSTYLNSGGKDVGRAMQLFKSEFFKQGKVPGMSTEAWTEMGNVINNPKSTPSDLANVAIKYKLKNIPAYVTAAEKGKATAAANIEENRLAVETEKAEKAQDAKDINTAQELMKLKKIRETQDPTAGIQEISNSDLDKQIAVLQTKPAVANMLKMTQARIKDVKDNKEKIVKTTQIKLEKIDRTNEEISDIISKIAGTFKGTDSDPMALLLKMAAQKSGLKITDADNADFKGAVGIQRKSLLYMLQSKIKKLSGLTGTPYNQTFENELSKIINKTDEKKGSDNPKGSATSSGSNNVINSNYGLPK